MYVYVYRLTQSAETFEMPIIRILIQIWTSARDFGTYGIGEQRRFGRVCAYDQTRQSIRCSHTQSMAAVKESDQNLDL